MQEETRMALVTGDDLVSLYWKVIICVCDVFKAPYPTKDEIKDLNPKIQSMVYNLFNDPNIFKDSIEKFERGEDQKKDPYSTLHDLSVISAIGVLRLITIQIKRRSSQRIEVDKTISDTEIREAIGEFLQSKGIKIT